MKVLKTNYQFDEPLSKEYAQEVLIFCSRVEDLLKLKPDLPIEKFAERLEDLYSHFKSSLITKDLLNVIEKEEE